MTASSRFARAVERRFDLAARGSTIGREVLAGLTSFLAAAYLVIVIPSLLTSGGMDHGAVTVATILVIAIGSTAMGIYANLPFIVGPGIGGSVILGVTLAQVDHVPWPVGLGIAFLAGLAFVLLTLTGARGIVVRMVPPQIKLGLGASIGLFIAMVGCRDAGMVAINAKSNALALGDFSQPGVIAALIGLAVAVTLQARKLPGALLAGILAATLVGIPFGLTHLPATAVAAPAPLGPVAFALDVPGAVTLAAMPYLFAFFVAEFFSTLGTTLAVGAKAGLTDADGNLPRIERPFLVDALTATLGPLVGVPTGTALVESAAGVQAGGRSGLTAIAAAACFAVTLALTPLAMAIPKQATASALILTGISMLASIRHLQGDEPGDVLPAMAMILVTLISNSFGTGIAAGILVHVAVQILAGRVRQLPIGLILLAIPLGFFFYGAATHH